MPQDFYIVSWQLSDIFWLKSNIYPERVPVMTNNTLTQDVSFIKIFTFWDINSIILQNLYLSQLICTNNHLRKSVDSICCYYLANNYYYIIQFKWFFFFSMVYHLIEFDFHIFLIIIIWVIICWFYNLIINMSLIRVIICWSNNNFYILLQLAFAFVSRS